jgi:glycine/sarcosine N-methyltransferase
MPAEHRSRCGSANRPEVEQPEPRTHRETHLAQSRRSLSLQGLRLTPTGWAFDQGQSLLCQRDAMVEPEDFYNALAPEYHLLFGDWWSAGVRHAEVIAELLSARGIGTERTRLLDCTCGIGTQALPLAAAGYDVTGTDISIRAVERAAAEARRRNLRVRLAVGDVRRVDEVAAGPFDAAISCDNSLPHLLTDADLARAIQSIRACLREGGVFLASIRDYDALRTNRPAGTPIALHGVDGSRYGSGQAWTWSLDDNQVEITLFTLTESPDHTWSASVHETTYRALQRRTLTAALRSNGFAAVEWLMPEESGYYQPVVLGIAEALSE